jgi:GATA-binding protein
MAAISTSSPLSTTATNPTTTTEHDYRFPRRPADRGTGELKSEQSEGTAATKTAGTATTSPNNTNRSALKYTTATGNRPKGAAAMRSTLKELRFDLHDTVGSARGKLSQPGAFASFDDGIAGMAASPEDLGSEDPLATQVWRFFTKTKQSLPNQERMENLTWRMMHTSLRKQRQADAESSRYGSHMRLLYPARWGKGGRQHPPRDAKKRKYSSECLVANLSFVPTQLRRQCPKRYRPAAEIVRIEQSLDFGSHELGRFHRC